MDGVVVTLVAFVVVVVFGMTQFLHVALVENMLKDTVVVDVVYVVVLADHS
jgi:hypothetical protein